MIRLVPLTRLALLLLLAAGIGWTLTHRDLLRSELIEQVLLAPGIRAPIGFILTACNLAGATLGATLAFILARTVAGE